MPDATPAAPLDWPALRRLAEGQGVAPLFVTVSGAHLYGFPSPDSDVDLRGAHLLPLRDVVGLDLPDATLERKLDLAGTEVELVSHDLGKYLRLLVKNNGYVLEQIFSPLVVLGDDFLARLRPLAQRCITRHHYHHYRGFLATQRRLLGKQSPWRVKPLLYAYRVALTGLHLMKTGEVDADLPRLAARYDFPELADLVARKRAETVADDTLDRLFHETRLAALETTLACAFAASSLPEAPDRRAVHDFLVEQRLRQPFLEGGRGTP